MIGRIKGRLIDKSPPIILVDCQGVGYELEVTMTTFYELPDIGNDVTLLTHFVVREDAQLLFGFASHQERKIFKQLIKVNGIGAKVALSILSGISLNELMRAINQSESDLLVKIPGIGKKTADRLVLELKDKFKDIPADGSTDSIPSQVDDIQNALLGLGYSLKDAVTVIRDLPDEISVNNGIRQALKMLSKNL
jgi:Holliday junction DNA helicase RuvA